MKKSMAFAFSGFVLIAVTYGMARFSWGIMLPDIKQAIPLSVETAGLIAACSYAAYCLSVLFASLLTNRFGARFTASLAAITAAVGLLILAVSPAPLCLAIGLFIAGLSSGLASPSLAGAVSAVIPPERNTQVNTVINAGTSGGIILSVPILFFLPGGWRFACVAFALLALLCLIPVWRFLPAGKAPQAAVQQGWRVQLAKPAMLRLLLIAFVSGIASAAWWSFGPELLQRHTGLESGTTNILWLISGGAGIAAVLTGSVAQRTGMRVVYRGSQIFMAVSLILLALIHGFSGWLIPAVALNGAGYVILSGVLLVQGAAIAASAPAMGVSLAFLMLAVGQIVGAIVFGQLYGAIGAAGALMSFSALSWLMLCVTPGGDTPTD